ncbi:Gibberellin 3-beta hydroxylase [Quillaja saponaria]|uniref:Gibberellin 3-beta hydroxylase n=1 Tax=Quillaja saponaria TaxID=32244 RepID=A0AAD7L6N2_QUISA|nr:Gibberellin 3-beta hydroxylase [Quillaja saponaria]
MQSLSDAFRSHPVYLHHKHQDFNSLQQLPDSYTWTQLDHDQHRSSKHSFSLQETVPLIDLMDPNTHKLIGHACKSWGIFQVINHGIPSSLLNEIESTSKTLFSLPLEQKLKAARSPDGVSGYGVARISSFFTKRMWHEGFTAVGSPLDHFRQLWPQDHSKYCDLLMKYEKEMKMLAGRLM